MLREKGTGQLRLSYIPAARGTSNLRSHKWKAGGLKIDSKNSAEKTTRVSRHSLKIICLDAKKHCQFL